MTQEDLKSKFDYHENGWFIAKFYYPRKYIKPGKILKGTVDSNGYAIISVDGKTYRMHRLIFLWHHGFLPQYTDHINRNRMDNRIENLRAVNANQSVWNRGINRNNKCGVKGVHWDSSNKKFIAQISRNGIRHVIGRFKTLDEACKAYEEYVCVF